MRRNFLTALHIGTIAVLAHACLAAAADESYKKHPGYVDFASMGVFGDLEATVEVFLKGPLLDMAKGALANEEPEVADAISKIEYIHVQQFELDRNAAEEVAKKTKELAKQLDAKGWEVVVRVREHDEQVYIYMLPGKDSQLIRGLVVMVVEEDDEATFVNIVGDMDPRNLGRVTGAFGHYDLDDFDINIDNGKDKNDKDRRTHRP